MFGIVVYFLCLQRFIAYRVLVLLFAISSAKAVPIPADSLIYKDTLIGTKIIRSSRPLRIGAQGSYGINYYRDANLPPSLSASCDTFTSGRGNGLHFLARIDIPFGSDQLGLYLVPALAYGNFSGDHTWGEFQKSNDTSGGKSKIKQVIFNHVISNSTKGLGIELRAGWQFLKPFSFEFGPAFYYLFDQNYTKTEKSVTNDLIITPSKDTVTEFAEASGALPNANKFLAALSFSLGAEFPLSKKLFAYPNVEFLLPLNRPSGYWNFMSIRGGITLKYELSAPSDTVSEYRHEQIPVKIPEQRKPELSASIEALNYQGNPEHVVRLEVEEVRVHYAYPLLNYIFFNEGSSQIPARYAKYPSLTEAQKNISALSSESTISTIGRIGLIGLYHEVLNILGDRLRKSPKMHIGITGCTSNTGMETGNTTLAQARAEAIKDYLVTTWQIEPVRIKTESRLLPEKPSPSDIPEGQAENRRVEITSSEESLTDPLIVTKTEHIANPPSIYLQPHVRAEAGLASYRSSISVGGKELVSFLGAEQKPWSVTEEALSSGIDSLDINLEVTDSAGNSVSAHNSVKLELRRIERERQQELEKFSLILFAFDESKLGAKNERTLRLVAESFKKTIPKKISIIGYTDELGDASHNDELSKRRAEEASAELAHALRNQGLQLPESTLIDGKGSREKLYDNSLPEGRLFSRTVNITIEH